MKKKLLNTICAFSAMSILCSTPVMAQTTSDCDSTKQLTEAKVLTLCNTNNCQELEKTILSLNLACNFENLSEYLQNLVNFNCTETPEIKDEITEPDGDTSLPEEDNNIPEDDNSIPEQDTNTPEQDNNAPEQDTDTPGQDNNAPEQDTDTPEQDNNVPEQDTATPIPVVTATPEITSTPVIENTDFVSSVAELVNAERAKVGLSPVTLDTTLSKAAHVRATEIVNSFSHTRPNGSSFSTAITEQGIFFRGSGENIAYGQKTPEAVMNAWMNSDGHRANILNANYTKIGVGYYQTNGVNYWTQLFTY